MNRNLVSFIFMVLIIGMLMGTILSMFVVTVIPDGVVKDFFLVKKSVGWGATSNNWIDVGFFRFKTGLFLDLSILSIFGFFVSWYLLRYFK